MLSRTTRLADADDNDGADPDVMSCSSSPKARLPRSIKSWETVVSDGMVTAARGSSSKPMTLTSPGTDLPPS